MIYAIPDGSLIAEQIAVNRVSLEVIEKQSYERIIFQPAFIVSTAVHIISNGTFLFEYFVLFFEIHQILFFIVTINTFADNILFILGTTNNNVEVICAKFAYIVSVSSYYYIIVEFFSHFSSDYLAPIYLHLICFFIFSVF